MYRGCTPSPKSVNVKRKIPRCLKISHFFYLHTKARPSNVPVFINNVPEDISHVFECINNQLKIFRT